LTPGGQIYDRMGILMAAKKYETLNVSPQIKALAKDALVKPTEMNDKYPNEMGKPSLNDLIDLAINNFLVEMQEIEEEDNTKEVWW
jgi:hypothetical protein